MCTGFELDIIVCYSSQDDSITVNFLAAIARLDCILAVQGRFFYMLRPLFQVYEDSSCFIRIRLSSIANPLTIFLDLDYYSTEDQWPLNSQAVIISLR